MNQQIVRAARKELANTESNGVVRGASTGLIATGGIVLGAGAVALILPFITLPMLAVIMVLAGIGLRFL